MDSVTDHPILLIEKISSKEGTFTDPLIRKGFKVITVGSGRLALQKTNDANPELIILNASSMGTNGLRICSRISSALEETSIIHIMPEGTTDEEAKKSPAQLTLVMPFTPRKLINRIKSLIPTSHDDMIRVGRVEYSSSARIVRAYGKEKQLTPKTAKLLELFLKHPDETLERSFLMYKVWETEYIGDTRTLDVHIRWLREIVEKKPSSPRHLITVRGKGYRFNPDPQKKSG